MTEPKNQYFVQFLNSLEQCDQKYNTYDDFFSFFISFSVFFPTLLLMILFLFNFLLIKGKYGVPKASYMVESGDSLYKAHWKFTLQGKNTVCTLQIHCKLLSFLLKKSCSNELKAVSTISNMSKYNVLAWKWIVVKLYV